MLFVTFIIFYVERTVLLKYLKI